MSQPLKEPVDVATLLSLKPKKRGAKMEWHGANPTGTGATKDGYILFEAGNATDRNGSKYNPFEVAKHAQISPKEYGPCVRFLEAQGAGTTNGAQKPEKRPPAPKKQGFSWETCEITPYEDASGNLVVEVGRIGEGADKQIRQRFPDGKGGWLPTGDHTTAILLLPAQIYPASSVYVVEGEKAAKALNAEFERSMSSPEHVATTNIGGAGKWHDRYNALLAGKNVFVLADNDEQGERHALQVLESLASMPPGEKPARLCRVQLDGLAPKGDVFDWLQAGHIAGELLELAEKAPDWAPTAEKEEVPRFETFTFADIDRLPLPRWLVRGLLVERTASILSADSGSFKSFFALDMALCVATGRPFHGRDVKQGNVVYIAAEGFYTLKERGTAWAMRNVTQLPGNFHALRVPINLADARVVAAFAAQFRSLKPSLIVLDTLSQNALGLNENSNDEMARFVSGMMQLGHELEAHVQVVHHNAKAGGVRGAGAIHNNADAHISLERPEGDELNTVFVRCEKQRGAPFEPFTLRGVQVVLPFEDEYGTPVTSLAFELTGDVPTAKRDGRSDRRATSKAQLIALLKEMTANTKEGDVVTKPDWMEEATKRGICVKSGFYALVNDLENEKRWFYWKGACRLEEEEKVTETPVLL